MQINIILYISATNQKEYQNNLNLTQKLYTLLIHCLIDCPN